MLAQDSFLGSQHVIPLIALFVYEEKEKTEYSAAVSGFIVRSV